MADEHGERLGRAAELLRINILTEVRAINAALRLGLDEPATERMADAVAAEVLYSFDVDWAPDWLTPGSVHSWHEAGAHYARCGICLADSPATPTEAAAVKWARDHESSHL